MGIRKLALALILLVVIAACIIVVMCVNVDNVKEDSANNIVAKEEIVAENTEDTEEDAEIEEATNVVGYNVVLSKPSSTENTIENIAVENTTENINENIDSTYFNENDVIALAIVLYNECRGVPSTVEKACVGWIACNRVDAGYADTVYDVLTAPSQFAYNKNTPVDEELYNLALDVLTRWSREKSGESDVGRVLPSDYLYFHGDGKHNYFRNAYSGNYNTWDYSLSNPYGD